MSAADCLRILKTLDPDDAAAVRRMHSGLVASNVPTEDAWTQAAELVMEDVLEERNKLADQTEGALGKLDIENLLNPASYDRGVAEPRPYYGTRPRQGTPATRIRDKKTRLPGTRVTNDDIAQYFDEQYRKEFGEPGNIRNRGDMARAKRRIKAEIQHQLMHKDSGLGWYDEDVHDAMQISGEFIPELATDPAHRQLMTVVAGILSQGQKAKANWKNATNVMREYKRTGAFPTRNEQGELFGRYGHNIAKQLEFTQKAVDDIGMDAFVEFMMGTHTGRELRAFKGQYWSHDGIEGRVRMNERYFGARLFGPKVGNFVTALNGMHGTDAVMDVWATRTFNRHFGKMAAEDGTIVDAPTEAQREKFSEMMGAIASELGLEVRDAQAVIWYFEQQLFAGLGARNRPESFAAGARAYADAHRSARQGQAPRTRARKAETGVEEGGKEYPVPPGPRRSPDSIREDKDRRRDVLTAGTISGEAAQAQAADTFHALYEAREVATVQSGVDHIKSHGDMAHLVAEIRKHAQETFFVAITDDKGKILNVIRHSIGTRDGASVYPIDIVGAIAATKGAKRYWLAHNHPSGVREPSMADQRITENIQAHTVGMPVRYMGHVIIGDTRYADAMGAQPDTPIPAYARRKKVPTTEFKLKRRAINDLVVLTRPADVMGVVRTLESESGIILLDNRHRVNGVLGLTTEEMSKLRDGKQVRRILSGIAKSNAAALIGFNKGPGGRAALENLSNYFSHISKSARVLDMIAAEPAGNLYAFSEQGLDVGTDKRPFKLISRKTPGRARLDKTRQMRQVKRWAATPIKRLQGRVPIVWLHHPSEAPFDIHHLAAGAYYDGKVYQFTDNIRDQKEAIKSLEHEAIGHLGLEGSLGHKKFAELLGDVLNLRVEMMMDPKAHPEIAKVVAELKKHYVDKNGKYDLDAREEAREILAHIVHSKPRTGRLREIYNKVVAWLKEWAANVGLADPDMAHIESLIVKAVDYTLDPANKIEVERQKPAAIINQGPGEDPNEAEYYRKLGMGEEDTRSLLRKMTDMRWGGIKDVINAATSRGYEGLFDGLIEIKRKEVEAGVGLGQEKTYLTAKGVEKKTVDYEGSAYVAARLATGVSDMVTHLLNYGALKWEGNVVGEVEGTRGFLDVLSDLGPENLKDWLIWMAGNRANELWSNDPEKNRERNLTREEIDQAMTHNQGKEKLFEDVRQEYLKINRLQLDFAQDAGLINPEKRAEWESDWYVPFYRQNDEDMTLGPHTTRGLSHQSAGLRRLIGSPIPTADLLTNIMTNWMKLTDASVKNHALRQMIDNFKDTDERQLGYLSDETMQFKKALIPKNEIHSLIKQSREFAARLSEWLDLPPKTTADGIWDAVSDLDSSGFETLWQIVAPKDPDIVRVQRNGKNEFYRVHVPGLLRAVGSMTPIVPKSKLMRAAMGFKQLLTMGVTASPDFMLRNFIRDAAHSWAINKDNMFFLKDSFKGLMEAKDEGPLHRAMMAAGASFQGGYMHGTDPEATANIMRRELIKAGWSEGKITKFLGTIVDNPAKLAKVVGWGWQHYRAAGDKIENASRVATARAGMEAGKHRAQWLFESKDLMDYSRRGNFSALIALTDVMPFLNARIQGMDKLGRATAQDPWKVAGKAAWIMGFSIFLATLNDDDDDYQSLPDWEKDAYWHLFPPGPNGEKTHVRIPKPFEIGFIAATMPERMWRAYVTDTQPNEKVIWALHHGFRETLSISIYPQIMLPVTEVVANRHFYFDQPIESMADKNVISSKRYNQYTSEAAILAGDTALAEWLGLSPKQLQHLWNGYTGTLGAYALGMADLAINPIAGFPKPEERQIEDYPLVKSLYKGQRKRTTQWQIDFYDRLKEARELHGTLQKLIKDRQREEAREFLTEHRKKLGVRRGLESMQRVFSKLRTQREMILKNDKLTPAEKYRKSQAIQSQINALSKKIEAHTREAFAE